MLSFVWFLLLLHTFFAKIYYIFLILCFYQRNSRSKVNNQFRNGVFACIWRQNRVLLNKRKRSVSSADNVLHSVDCCDEKYCRDCGKTYSVSSVAVSFCVCKRTPLSNSSPVSSVAKPTMGTSRQGMTSLRMNLKWSRKTNDGNFMHRVKWCKRRWRLLMTFILLNPAFCAVVMRRHPTALLPWPHHLKRRKAKYAPTTRSNRRSEGELRFEVRSEFWAYRFGRRSNWLEWLGRTRGAHTYQLAVANIKSEVLRFSSAIGKMGTNN